jgi:DeoR/GlpR family transcriptional regulator of sugar metabolism
MRWFEEQRMEWIAETLRVFGFINREHLQRKFGISQPQASKDLQTFARQHPGAIAYDLSSKRYVAKG